MSQDPTSTPKPRRRPSTSRRMVLMAAVVIGLLGLIVGFNILKGAMIQKYMASQGEPPQTVTTTTARFAEWQPSLSAVGTVRAIHGADLAFEVAGSVVEVNARPGSEVTEGDRLVRLNDAAEAAELRRLDAAAELSRVIFERAKQQLAVNTISQSDYDTASADLRAKRAAVEQQAAVVAKKSLVAPFAGHVGIVSTSPGAYLNAGTPVVTLQQLDPVYLDFYVPQREAGRVSRGQAVVVKVDSFPGEVFRGTVTAVNPKVDPSTRNVQIEATFPNEPHRLIPGMFADVSLDVGGRQRYLTLPQTAITYNPYGATVFVVSKVSEKLVAQQVFVTTGPTRGDQVSILNGLDEGAEVVTSGGLKLKNGTPLAVDNKVQPKDDPNPAPQER